MRVVELPAPVSPLNLRLESETEREWLEDQRGVTDFWDRYEVARDGCIITRRPR